MAVIQDTAATEAQVQGTPPLRIGFDGHAKLGCWTPVNLSFDSSIKPTKFAITALDGTGIPVEYSGKLLGLTDHSAQAWINLGRSVGNVKIDLLDEQGEIVYSQTRDLSRPSFPKIIESTTPMILCIEQGSTLQDDIKAVEIQLFGTTCQISSISDCNLLPYNSLSYQGIRVIYLSLANPELIQSITNQQWDAIDQWVFNGGKLVISLGPSSNELIANAPSLKNLIPGTISGTFKITNSIQFERFARSKPPQLLKRGDTPIVATILEEPQGIVQLAIGKKPLVVRKPYGFGQVVCSTVDVDLEPLNKWNGHKKFLMRLTNGQLNLNRTTENATNSRNVVTYGYGDILGQLVFPLEKFSRVRFINFTIVAVLIALFLLCIGPGDFFLLRKTIGKMEWTWLTFPTIAAAFCLLAIYISSSTKPDAIQVNQLEIIDIDQQSGAVRGNVWTNTYSPTNSKNDISISETNSLGIDTSAATLCWMGIPGPGLGGMNSQTGAGLQLQKYACEFNHDSLRSTIRQLPIKVSSTKTLLTQYQDKKDFNIRSRLRLNPRRNRLQGTIKNPFDFKLEECRVVFDNWTYILNLPLEANDTVDIGSNFKEKTAASYFTRRADTETDKGGSLPWNPEENNMDRIVEMMMFYEFAGGKQYTRLTHEFLPQIDLSELIGLRRAILWGKVAKPNTALVLDSSAGDFEYDHCSTYIRIVLPVEYELPNSKRRQP